MGIGAALCLAAPASAQEFAQLVIRRSVIVRVPTQAAPLRASPAYKEKKGPKCVPLGDLAGAAIIEPGSVDMILKGGTRLRARFSASCPDLDYYGGFYIEPTGDGRLCADRDAIHARSGGSCEIDRFRRLTAR